MHPGDGSIEHNQHLYHHGRRVPILDRTRQGISNEHLELRGKGFLKYHKPKAVEQSARATNVNNRIRTEWCSTNLTSPLSMPSPKASRHQRQTQTSKQIGPHQPIVAQTTLTLPFLHCTCRLSFSLSFFSAWYTPVRIFLSLCS